MSGNESSETTSLVDESWVSWFCNLNGNHVLCEVDKQFMEDSFNLFGLKQHITKDFNKALFTILDRQDGNDEDSEEDVILSSSLLYGMIHARYIITTNGLLAMQKKYQRKEFGECPRTYCNGQAVLPVGMADDPNLGSYKLFCPKCRDLFNCLPSQSHVDGAYFGTSFPHIFLMTYDDLVPSAPSASYTPRVFGFKVHATSSSLPKKVVVLDGHSNSEGTSYSDGLNLNSSAAESETAERKKDLALTPGHSSQNPSQNSGSRNGSRSSAPQGQDYPAEQAPTRQSAYGESAAASQQQQQGGQGAYSLSTQNGSTTYSTISNNAYPDASYQQQNQQSQQQQQQQNQHQYQPQQNQAQYQPQYQEHYQQQVPQQQQYQQHHQQHHQQQYQQNQQNQQYQQQPSEYAMDQFYDSIGQGGGNAGSGGAARQGQQNQQYQQQTPYQYDQQAQQQNQAPYSSQNNQYTSYSNNVSYDNQKYAPSGSQHHGLYPQQSQTYQSSGVRASEVQYEQQQEPAKRPRTKK